ncbi:septum formation family protein [Georgenia phoenicis]|uniref:septum formation family protein n=1 Tax=unclassified Georgenia TaxID=2626815 RepID=UPI0039B051A3
MSLRRPVIAVAAALTLLGTAGCTMNSVLDLEVGDCVNLDDLQGDEVSTVKALDCSEEHDGEIFGEHVFSGDEYPGEATVQEESDAACTEQFEEFMGLPYLESELYFVSLYPSEESWDKADDRTSLCIVQAPETMTESLEGAKI